MPTRPSGLLFGSELKALRAHPLFDERLDRDALASYFRYAYMPAPREHLSRRFARCRRAHCSSVAPDGRARIVQLLDRRRGRARRPRRAIDAVRRRSARPARSAAARRGRAAAWIADVPLGAFLSGGIDSSMVVALMQAQSDAAGAHVHDRLRRGGLQRGRITPRRWRAPRHRPHRALRDAATRRAPSSRGCRASTTSRSPTRRRSRRSSCRRWRVATSP